MVFLPDVVKTSRDIVDVVDVEDLGDPQELLEFVNPSDFRDRLEVAFHA